MDVVLGFEPRSSESESEMVDRYTIRQFETSQLRILLFSFPDTYPVSDVPLRLELRTFEPKSKMLPLHHGTMWHG
jgi:hypothetical protein